MTDSHKARFAGHVKHGKTCVCGKVIHGNGRMTHQRACEPYLREHGYPLADGVVEGIRADLREYGHRWSIANPGGAGRRPVYASDVLPGIQRRIGDAVLARRAAGNRRALDWREVRELLRPAYEAALAELTAAHNGARRP